MLTLFVGFVFKDSQLVGKIEFSAITKLYGSAGDDGRDADEMSRFIRFNYNGEESLLCKYRFEISGKRTSLRVRATRKSQIC